MGHFMLEEGFCAKCESYYDACLDCENNKICKTCDEGFTLREYNFDDGYREECTKCPTEDGCDTCFDNKCQTCLPGYFMDPIDNLCYKCKAYLDGCEECSSSRQCIKCSDVGFLITDAGSCECNSA
jgi:hypothetical protein